MSNPMQMLQTNAQMQSQNAENAQHQMNSLGKSKLSEADKEKKLREACEGFESIFIQKMWQQMRATLPQENPLVGREEKFWQGMYDQELSKKMASDGGIGLADMMYDQLSQSLVSASRTTASGLSEQRGFQAEAAPLIPEAAQGKDALKETSAERQSVQMSAKSSPVTGGALYEAVPTAAQGHASAATPAMPQASPVGTQADAVQQYLVGLQQKQAGQSPTTAPVAGHLAGAPTSPMSSGLAASLKAQQVAGSPPPAQGVLPPHIAGGAAAPTTMTAQASTSPFVMPPNQDAQSAAVRTTYTTNIPKNRQSERELRQQAEARVEAQAEARAEQAERAQQQAQLLAQQQAVEAQRVAQQQLMGQNPFVSAPQGVAAPQPSPLTQANVAPAQGALGVQALQAPSVAMPYAPSGPVAPLTAQQVSQLSVENFKDNTGI